MARTSLPPGFRFHPTDVELVMYYLKRKIIGKKLQFEAISELNIYKYCPWDLKDKSCLRSKDLEWFFFCPRERKYASGARTNRATESGYWKTTGKDRQVIYNDRAVGMVKTLVFHLGHAPQGKRTDWVMHEYRFKDKDLPEAGVVQDAYVLCKVFKKSGPGPKNGAQYGAPFNEDDYDDEGICAESSAVNELAPPLVSLPNNMNGSCSTSMIGPGNSMNSLSFSEPGPSTAGPSVSEVSPALCNNDVDMDSLLAVFREEGTSLPIETDNTEELEALNPDDNIAAINCSDGNDIYNGLGDLGYLVDPSNGGFNFSNIPEADYNPIPVHMTDDTAFLELNDLNTPLPFPSEASGSAHLRTANSVAPYTCYDSYEQFCREDNFFGAAQNVSASNQLPPLPESLGSHFNSLKENGIGSGANQEGYSAATSGNMYFTRGQAGGSMNAAEAQIRGENQRKHVLNGGSSINAKAEVTPRNDGCTKDALSHNLEESFTTLYTYSSTTYTYSSRKIIVANCVDCSCAYNLHLGMIFMLSIGLNSKIYGVSIILEMTVISSLWIDLISYFNHWICIKKLIISSVKKFNRILSTYILNRVFLILLVDCFLVFWIHEIFGFSVCRGALLLTFFFNLVLCHSPCVDCSCQF